MPQSTQGHQTVRLARGKHQSPASGACVMELASMLAGEPFTDRPVSVCPVIAAFLRAYNDAVDGRERQRLYLYAALVVGTRADAAVEKERMRRLLAEFEARWHDRRRHRRPRVVALPLGDGELEYIANRVAAMLWRERRRGGADRAQRFVDDLLSITSTARPACERWSKLRSADSQAPLLAAPSLCECGS
jgi:hypothetical protein